MYSCIAIRYRCYTTAVILLCNCVYVHMNRFNSLTNLSRHINIPKTPSKTKKSQGTPQKSRTAQVRQFTVHGFID